MTQPVDSDVALEALPPPIDVFLKSGRERPVRFGHPWIFSGALRGLDAKLEPGSIVRVRTASGELIGSGYANPRCPIAVRLLAWGEETVDADLIGRRVREATRLRSRLIGPETTAYRLINGEGDHLAGFLVDRYDDVLVLQCLTAGADKLRPWLLAALQECARPSTVVERSEGSVRQAEGLSSRTEVLFGPAAQDVIVKENGLPFLVTPAGGQKTGFFCDQRPNRLLLRRLAEGRRVLDLFAYTGAFSVHAGAGGAKRVVAVESSSAALDTARQNWARNGLHEEHAEFVQADVRKFLRQSDESFDLLVLDPPAWVRQRKDVARGARAYKDLHLWALRRAEPGALMLTFTCSQHLDAELFRKIVLGAAVDAGRRLQVLRSLGPGSDHPVAMGHPEGVYLHGLLLRVV